MANTLTGLTKTIYLALDKVSRELVGFIPNVYRNSTGEQAALNQEITYPVAPAATAIDITPAVNAPDNGDQTIGNGSLKITKSRAVPVRWNGEQQRGAINSGWYSDLLMQQFAQAFRTLGNEIEADFAALYTHSSRAYGTAGTAPFGTANDLSDLAGVRQILEDNGCPTSELRLILGTSAAANIRGKQAQLFKVNESGTDGLLRRGDIGDLEGFRVGVSAQVKKHTKGGGTLYVTNGSTAAGVTDIALVTGSGDALAGDVVGFAADTANKYVIGKGVTAPGTISLNKPGALVTIATANAMTIGGSYTANLAFDRMALHLITRVPAMPIGPDGKPMDSADDVMLVTDPVTGLTFQISMYKQFKQIVYMVELAWGTGCVKDAHLATLLG